MDVALLGGHTDQVTQPWKQDKSQGFTKNAYFPVFSSTNNTI